MQKNDRDFLADSVRLLEEASELLYEESWKRWKSRNPNDPKSVDRCSVESSRFGYFSAEAKKLAEKLKGE